MHIGQRTTCGNDFLFPSHGVPESITGRQVWQQASLFADPSPQSLEIFLRDGFSHWGPTSEERASELAGFASCSPFAQQGLRSAHRALK